MTGVQSNVVSTRDGQSSFSRITDAPTDVIAGKNASWGAGQQKTDGGSLVDGAKMGFHSTAGFVTVQAPTPEKNNPVSVSSHSKSYSSTALQCSEQGANEDRNAFDS